MLALRKLICLPNKSMHKKTTQHSTSNGLWPSCFAMPAEFLSQARARAWMALIFVLLGLIPIAQADTAVNVEKSRITLNLKTEPPTLNSLLSTDQVSTFVLSHVMEGLLQYGPENRLAAGVAERWELRADGVTFWLRNDARWSDGRPVTAHDFVFAWRMAVAPATASQYAFILFPLLNAEAINSGKLPVERLGVEAVGDYELRVQFARPCPYFLSLTAFPTYYPIREDIYRQSGSRYAADKSDLVFNGPFVVSQWIHGAHLQLDKNPQYWQRDRIRLNTIDMPYVTNDNTAIFNLYKSSAVALSTLTVETLPEALERGDTLFRFSTGTVSFLEFNFRDERVTTNLAFRQAIKSLVDPSVLVNKVVAIPGVLPSDSLFPSTVKGVEQSFRQEFPPPVVKHSLSDAKQFLAKAKQELQLTDFPPLILLVNDSPVAARQAEYLQYLFKRALNIDVRIDKQVFKQYLDKMTRGNFDIALAGWGPDYDDVMTFADLMASWNENNRGRYKSERYDQGVRAAMAEADPQRRMQIIATLQQVIADEIPIIPLYENAEIYIQHPQLKGVSRSIFGGDPSYRYAWLEKR
jgi:oligopeptide transport system substrate-binding protein